MMEIEGYKTDYKPAWPSVAFTRNGEITGTIRYSMAADSYIIKSTGGYKNWFSFDEKTEALEEIKKVMDDEMVS